MDRHCFVLVLYPKRCVEFISDIPMSRKSLDFSALVILLVVIFYSDFRDMGLSEMNSTHHFGYETSSKQCRIIEFVGCNLIVKSLVQGVKRGVKEGGRGGKKVLQPNITQQLL